MKQVRPVKKRNSRFPVLVLPVDTSRCLVDKSFSQVLTRRAREPLAEVMQWCVGVVVGNVHLDAREIEQMIQDLIVAGIPGGTRNRKVKDRPSKVVCQVINKSGVVYLGC